MKNIIIGAIIVVALAGLVFFSVKGNGEAKGEKVYLEETAQDEIVQIVKATGVIDPRVKVNLSSPLIGKIESLYVEEGDWIEAGQPFLQLEKEAFEAVRNRSVAELGIAKSRVRQAEINLEDAQLKLNRARRLAEESVFSKSDLESAELQYRSQELAAEQAREGVLQAQATVDQVSDDLSKTTIYAPLTGRVTALNAEQGEVVVSGTMNNPGSIIGTISDLSEILAEVDVDETEVASLRLGQRAIITVDALIDRQLQGQVVEIGSSGFSRPSNPDVTFFKAKVLLDEPDEALRPGMSSSAQITTARADDAIIVPAQSVLNRPPVKEDDGEDEEEDTETSASTEELDVVFVELDGNVEQRTVVTGLSNITHVQIVSGLEKGDRVVTGPYRILKDLEHDDPVRERKRSTDSDDDDEDED